MSMLALFAETPRAGDLGHRFLVAGKDQTPERQIAEYLKSVDKDVSFGANFIGVARSVQQHSGIAVRTGREIIVLAGVDVSRIPRSSRDKVLTLLRDLLDRLERLVLNGVDWSRLPRADLVVRNPELSRWLDEIENLALPEVAWFQGPRPLAPAEFSDSIADHDGVGELISRKPSICPMPRRLIPLWLVLVLSLGMILLAAGMWFIVLPRRGAGDSRTHREPDNQLGVSESALSELAIDWDCSPEKITRSLLRAANWDRRREANSMRLDTGLKDVEVRLLFEKVASKNGVERLLVAVAINSEPEFRQYAQSHTSRPVAASRHMRKWLYDAWMKWERLSGSVASVREELDRVEGNDLTRMMVVIAQLQPDVGLGDEFREPDTPLFDRQDVMIWRFLNQCRVAMEEQGINQFLGKPVASPDSELASFVAAVGTSRGMILSALARSRALTTDTVRKAHGKENADLVFNSFEAFEDFIEHFAGLDAR